MFIDTLYIVTISEQTEPPRWHDIRRAVAISADAALLALRDEIADRYPDLNADKIVDIMEGELETRKTWAESDIYHPQNAAPFYINIETTKSGEFFALYN